MKSRSNGVDLTATVFIATSLDGYIAREDGGLDWLPADGGVSDSEDHGYHAFMASVDAVVMGRHTFQQVLTFGPWSFGDKPVVVLTSRSTGLPPLPAPTVEYMSGTPEEVVARLGKRGAQSLYIDGGVTIQRFLQAGLIDRFIITRIPVILGSGIPLFGRVARDIKLRHVETRQYRSGLVQSEYLVVGPRSL